AHALECAFAGQRAFPVGRAADVGALRAPLVQRTQPFARIGRGGEHGVVHDTEIVGLDAGGDDGVDFIVGGPDVLQGDRTAVLVRAKDVFLDIETYGAGNGVGDHQRGRGQEGLLGIGVD